MLNAVIASGAKQLDAVIERNEATNNWMRISPEGRNAEAANFKIDLLVPWRHNIREASFSYLDKSPLKQLGIENDYQLF
jgi:hypothetical protein